jgi:hypothetical protein
MKSSYKTLQNTWIVKEEYNPVTMPFSMYKQYLDSFNSVMDNSGGVRRSGTVQIPFSGNGAVVKGHVRQGYNFL